MLDFLILCRGVSLLIPIGLVVSREELDNVWLLNLQFRLLLPDHFVFIGLFLFSRALIWFSRDRALVGRLVAMSCVVINYDLLLLRGSNWSTLGLLL